MTEWVFKLAMSVFAIIFIAMLIGIGRQFYYDWKHDCHCVKSHVTICWIYQPALKMAMPNSCTVCDDKVCVK